MKDASQHGGPHAEVLTWDLPFMRQECNYHSVWYIRNVTVFKLAL